MSQPLAPTQKPATEAVSDDRFQPLRPTAEAVLRGAAKGLLCERGGFDRAELWLLDEPSRQLQLAAEWSADPSPLGADQTTKSRKLADAPADVAALAGGAVVLEDPSDVPGWDLHQPITGAAIGLPVASATTIHGVMWLLAANPRAIPDEAVELAEVVAGRLALEVEGKLEVNGAEPAPTAQPIEKALTKSVPPTPTSGSACVSPVHTAAWTAPSTDGLSAAACFQLPDRRLLALAFAAIDSPESSLVTQRASVEWIMDEAQVVAARTNDAGLLLTLLNRRLLESPLAGEGLAAAVALIDTPEDADAGLGGRGTFAIAGPTVSLSVRAASTETHAGDLVPLGWSEPEAAYASQPFELAVRQRLILVAGDPRLTSPLIERQLGDSFRAATADAHRVMTPEHCLGRLAASGAHEALAAVAIRRS